MVEKRTGIPSSAVLAVLVATALVLPVAWSSGSLASAPGSTQSDDLTELLLGVSHQPWEPDGREDPQVVVGTVPETFRERVHLPGDATVHGALLDPAGSTTVVATTPRTAGELWPEVRTAMEALGWRAPDTSTGLTRSLGDLALAWVFCGEERETVLFSVMDRDAGVRLRIDHHPEYRAWQCSRPAAPSSGQPLQTPDRRSRGLTRLTPPPYTGDQALGACRGRGGGGSSGLVPTALSGAELRAHYEPQLENAGWIRLEPDADIAPTVSEWSRDRSHAVLVLAPVPGRPGCWHMVFNRQEAGG